MWTAIIAGGVAGLASVTHCVAMCGSLSLYACQAKTSSVKGQAHYQLGRLVSYSGIGAVAGAVGHVAALNLPGNGGRAVLSWSLALGLMVVAYRLWRQPRPAPLVSITTKPADEVSPSRAARALRGIVERPLLLGFVTGFLPCGALAGAVLIAASTQSPAYGALSMFAFATVSGTGLAATILLASKFLGGARPFRSRLLAVAVGLGAIVFLIRPVGALRAETPITECHDHTGATSVLPTDSAHQGEP